MTKLVLFLLLALLPLPAAELVTLSPADDRIVQDILGEVNAKTLAPIMHLTKLATNNTDSPIQALMVNWKYRVEGEVLSHSVGAEVFADDRLAVIKPGETIVVAPLVLARKGDQLGDLTQPLSILKLENVVAIEVDIAIFGNGSSYGPNETGFVEQLFGRAKAAQKILEQLNGGSALGDLDSEPSPEFNVHSVTAWERQWRLSLTQKLGANVTLEQASGRFKAIKRPPIAEPPTTATLKASPVVKAPTPKNKILYGPDPCIIFFQADWLDLPFWRQSGPIYRTSIDPSRYQCSGMKYGPLKTGYGSGGMTTSAQLTGYTGVPDEYSAYQTPPGTPPSQPYVSCSNGSKVKGIAVQTVAEISWPDCPPKSIEVRMYPIADDSGIFAEAMVHASTTCGGPSDLSEARVYVLCNGSTQMVFATNVPCGAGSGAYRTSAWGVLY